jgi:hypothetical protein
MAEQKQDNGTTNTSDPTQRGTDQGTTQERNDTTTMPRAADKDRDRDDERAGQPGAQHGSTSKQHENKQENERGANTPMGRNDGRIGQAHEGNDKHKDASPIVSQGGRDDAGKQGTRNEERSGTSTTTAGARKSDEKDAQGSDRKGTERDLH